VKILDVKTLGKVFPNGVKALKSVSFEVNKGDFLVVIGLSGSGKTTLLRCINRLHDPTEGAVNFDNHEISKLKGKEIRLIRSKIGMIFQDFNLIGRKSVLTNVLLGKLSSTSLLRGLLGRFTQEDIDDAYKNIEIVGLKGKENQRADQLSGGQKQRIAIARALMQKPLLLLADEPVASLDPATSHSVMKYLKKINQEMGVTIICNLHFLSLVRAYASRVIALKDGELVFEGMPEQIDQNWFEYIYGKEAVEVTID